MVETVPTHARGMVPRRDCPHARTRDWHHVRPEHEGLSPRTHLTREWAREIAGNRRWRKPPKQINIFVYFTTKVYEFI